MSGIIFELTDVEAKSVLAFVDRVNPDGDGNGEFTVLYKLIAQYADQMPPTINFELTNQEAADVLHAFERINANLDGWPTVYFRLLEQYINNPSYITTEDGRYIQTEDGRYITTESLPL